VQQADEWYPPPDAHEADIEELTRAEEDQKARENNFNDKDKEWEKGKEKEQVLDEKEKEKEEEARRLIQRGELLLAEYVKRRRKEKEDAAAMMCLHYPPSASKKRENGSGNENVGGGEFGGEESSSSGGGGGDFGGESSSICGGGSEYYYEVTPLDAICFLGQLYEDGIGVPQRNEEALRYYRRAVLGKHSVTQCLLGYLYDVGKLGLEPNLKNAFRLYTLAAAQGNYVGQYNLALMYKVNS